MLTQESFRLTDDQLAAYNRWAAEQARYAGEGDAMFSHAITVSFSFSPFGRTVVAGVESSTARLVLED